MKRVYKYEIPATGHFNLELPKRATILKAETQFDRPCLWALVDPDAEKEVRKFLFAGTGHDIAESNLNHISTFQMQGGSFIFHIFEIFE